MKFHNINAKAGKMYKLTIYRSQGPYNLLAGLAFLPVQGIRVVPLVPKQKKKKPPKTHGLKDTLFNYE